MARIAAGQGVPPMPTKKTSAPEPDSWATFDSGLVSVSGLKLCSPTRVMPVPSMSFLMTSW